MAKATGSPFRCEVGPGNSRRITRSAKIGRMAAGTLSRVRRLAGLGLGCAVGAGRHGPSALASDRSHGHADESSRREEERCSTLHRGAWWQHATASERAVTTLQSIKRLVTLTTNESNLASCRAEDEGRLVVALRREL